MLRSLLLLLATLLGLAAPPAESVSPGRWHALFIQLVAQSGGFAASRPSFLPGRLKQWACMAHRIAPNGWYPQIKRLQTAQDILACMAELGV